MVIADIPGKTLTELNVKESFEKYSVRKTFAQFVLKEFDFEKSIVKPMQSAVCKEAYKTRESY